MRASLAMISTSASGETGPWPLASRSLSIELRDRALVLGGGTPPCELSIAFALRRAARPKLRAERLRASSSAASSAIAAFSSIAALTAVAAATRASSAPAACSAAAAAARISPSVVVVRGREAAARGRATSESERSSACRGRARRRGRVVLELLRYTRASSGVWRSARAAERQARRADEPQLLLQRLSVCQCRALKSWSSD